MSSLRANRILIEQGASRAEIAVDGAEMQAWSVGGRQLLWKQDPAIWPKSSPNLFPTVGRVRNDRFRHRGVEYPLGVHGFAAASTFAVEERTPSMLRLVLTDNAQTRAVYPFAFRFSVTHAMSEDGFATTLEVTNSGDEPLPYATGVHPGMCWPFAGGAKDDYAIVFEKPERVDVPAITADGLFRSVRREVPIAGRRLPLSEALMGREALCFLGANSQSLAFEHKAGAAIEMNVENLSHLAVWSKAGAPYLCLEPWSGFGDPEDFDGEITEKPSMTLLAPGATGRHVARFRWRAAL